MIQTSRVRSSPKRVSWRVIWIGASIVLGLAPEAAAQPSAPVSMTYRASAGCPDEATFAELVAARLGREPFVSESESTISVVLRSEGRRWLATLEWDREGGSARREIDSEVSCSEAAESLAVVVAVLLDDTPEPAPESPVPESTVEPATEEPASAPARDLDPEESAPSVPIAGYLALGPTVAFAASVDWTIGGRVEGGIGIDWLWLGLELTAEVQPGTRALGEGASADTSLFLVGASACVRIEPMALCVLGGGGGYTATVYGVSTPSARTSGVAFIGGRVGVTIPLFETFYLRPQLEVTGMVVRSAIAAGEAGLWEASPVAGRLGVLFGLDLR
jgi:hypothetical protein